MTRKSNFFYTKLPLAFITVAFLFATFTINISSAQESVAYYMQSEIVDGDLIQAIGDIDVYIVKIVGQKRFKRLILNPTIFDSYEHLDWENIKTVSRNTLNLYTTSNLVQQINPDGSIADERVFQLFPSGDTGVKRHVALTPEEFNAASGDWDSIYYINHTEAGDDFYNTNTAIEDMQEFREILEIRGEGVDHGQEQGEGVDQYQEVEDGISLSSETVRSPITFIPSPNNLPPPSSLLSSSYSSYTQPPFINQVNNITFGTTTKTEINLSWDAVNGATGYEVQYKEQGKPDEEYSDTNVEITGTTARVTSRKIIDVSWYERQGSVNYAVQYKEVSQTNWIDSSEPITGEALRTTRIGNLDFDTEYEFRVQTISGDGSYSYITPPITTIAQDVTYLAPGTTYSFRVRAIGEEWSTEVDHSTLLDTVGDFTFGTSTDSEINLSWEEIVGATLYIVEHCDTTNSADCGPLSSRWSNENVIITNQALYSQAQVTDLDPNTTYAFRAKAIKDTPYTEGAWSVSQNHQTEDGLARIRDLVIDTASYTQIDLSWGVIDGATSYEVEHCDTTNSADCSLDSLLWSNADVEVTGTTAIITNLTPGTTYSLRARAWHAELVGFSINFVTGPWSEVQNHKTKDDLAQVGNLAMNTAPSYTQVDISWEEITGAVSYEAQYCDASTPANCNTEDNWLETGVEFPSDRTTATASITNLAPGTTYSFRVRAIDVGRQGKWSISQEHSIGLATITDITFDTITNREINLRWSHVDGAIDYEFFYKKQGDPDSQYSNENVTIADETSYLTAKITNLEDSTEYTFIVRAVKVNVVGEWSSEISRSTRGTLSFGLTNDTEIHMNWVAVEAATSYEVQYKMEGEPDSQYTNNNVEIMGRVADVINLTPNTTYTFRLRAIIGGSTGAWSSPQNHSTLNSLAQVDANSFIFTRDDTQNRIYINWDAVEGASNYIVEYRATNVEDDTYLDENIGTFTFGRTTQSEINFSWSAVEGAIGYVVDYRTLTSDFMTANLEVTGTTAKLTRLKSGTPYIFRVRPTRFNRLSVQIPNEYTRRTTHTTLGTRASASNLNPDTEYTFRVKAWYGRVSGSTVYYVEGPWSDERTHSTAP